MEGLSVGLQPHTRMERKAVTARNVLTEWAKKGWE